MLRILILLTMATVLVASIWSIASQSNPQRWKDAAVGALCGGLAVGGLWMILADV